MELKLKIGYGELLDLVRQLPARDLAQFKKDVANIEAGSLSLLGAPVSVDDIMENLQHSEAQAAAGQVFTSEEVKQHIESWTNLPTI